MRRREFIAVVGIITATWPLAVRAQQPTTPVIGFLSGSSLKSVSNEVTAFQDGLKEAGFLDGRNVRIEYRWAEQHYDRLPALANELIAHRVAVIAATGGTASVLAAKAATSVTPIVFVTGGDPVQQRIVASLNQPGGNATGVSWLGNMLQSKQFETLHELVPNAALFAALVNPDNPNFETDVRALHMAADALGQKLLLVKAKGENDIGVGFATIVQEKVGGLVVIGDPFLISQRERLVALAALHALPAIYPLREYAVAGGLMSYGASLSAAYRQVGVYVGRTLKGDKPANLPVQQSTKVELVVNLKTAKALGLNFPLSLLNRADEVIE
jgi:putative tryptophan/tyrosine transport system substrate-binding protein